MLEIVEVPLSVLPRQVETMINDANGTYKERITQMGELEQVKVVELDKWLNEGYRIVDTHAHTANHVSWLRYTLHKHEPISTQAIDEHE